MSRTQSSGPTSPLRADSGPTNRLSHGDSGAASGILGWFRNFKIGVKIYIGFGVVLSALTVMGAIAYLSIGGMVDKFHSYANMAGDTVLAGGLGKELVELRLHVVKFIGSSDEKELKGVEENLERVRRDLKRAHEEIHNPERVKLLSEAEEGINRYVETFEEITALMAKRDKLVYEGLDPNGKEAREKLSELIKSAFEDEDYEAAVLAGFVQEDLLLGRLYVTKYLDTNNEEQAERAFAEFKELDHAVEALDKAVQNPKRRKLLETVEGDVTRYEETFGELVKIIGERNKLRAETLDPTGVLIAKTLTELAESTEKDEQALEEETATAGAETELETIIIAAFSIALGVLFAFVIARGITRPITAMTGAMNRLAQGDKTAEIPGLGRGDEIGSMAGAVQVFKDNAIEMDRMQKEREEAEHQRAEEAAARQKEAEERASRLGQLTQAFDKAVTGALEAVSSATNQLEASARSMAASTEETTNQTTAVAAASEQATSNVQTAASAAEELSNSITEISRQVGESAKVAQKAVEEANRTNTTVQGLAEAAKKIGEVVNLISDIAAQTNLLALNATIEAARAGDAGKGFAVVASEVKSLATQTAKATEEIAAQIGSIQGATGDAVKAIDGIGATITRINEIASAIASAVEEQGAATQEIARNVQEAATGTQEVSRNIGGVNQAATEVSKAATQVLQASSDVAKQSDSLRQDVNKFLGEVRAA
ncbi:MAG: methyl-accepting chemotaxis protein [Alphaproteobacteria bacterium]